MKTIFLLALVLFSVSPQWSRPSDPQPSFPLINYDKAVADYVAVAEGRKQVSQLTPEELAGVDMVDREYRQRGRGVQLTPKQRCWLMNRVSDNPTQLELRLLDLKCSQR